jgi:hypothetical protein
MRKKIIFGQPVDDKVFQVVVDVISKKSYDLLIRGVSSNMSKGVSDGVYDYVYNSILPSLSREVWLLTVTNSTIKNYENEE